MSRIILLEGIDGSGKDVQSRLLAKHLNAPVLHSPDYSGPIGKVIDQFLHHKLDIPAETQFLLYAADILKDRERIEQATGDIILNRTITSTIAYQVAHGFPLERVIAFVELLEFPKPDLILFLRVSPETAVSRKKNKDRFESIDVQKKVTYVYDQLIERKFFGIWNEVDGELAPEAVFEQIKALL